MTTLNQVQPIELSLPPSEVAWFRANAPHFLEAMKLQQTVIQQLVIRAGGSGSGSGVVNLDVITADIADLDTLAGFGDLGLAVGNQALRELDDLGVTAAESSANAQFSELKSLVDQLCALSTNETLIAEIASLRARVEALENGISYT
jgi:hypothetical protein